MRLGSAFLPTGARRPMDVQFDPNFTHPLVSARELAEFVATVIQAGDKLKTDLRRLVSRLVSGASGLS